jgi:hypothetical protein
LARPLSGRDEAFGDQVTHLTSTTTVRSINFRIRIAIPFDKDYVERTMRPRRPFDNYFVELSRKPAGQKSPSRY